VSLWERFVYVLGKLASRRGVQKLSPAFLAVSSVPLEDSPERYLGWAVKWSCRICCLCCQGMCHPVPRDTGMSKDPMKAYTFVPQDTNFVVLLHTLEHIDEVLQTHTQQFAGLEAEAARAAPPSVTAAISFSEALIEPLLSLEASKATLLGRVSSTRSSVTKRSGFTIVLLPKSPRPLVRRPLMCAVLKRATVNGVAIFRLQLYTGSPYIWRPAFQATA